MKAERVITHNIQYEITVVIGLFPAISDALIVVMREGYHDNFVTKHYTYTYIQRAAELG